MILVNGQFSHAESYRQLAHAAWNGWTFADTIFPCFLFIVGVSLTLSTASRMARGEDRTRLLWHALRRSLLLFACGVLIDYLRVPAREFPFIGLQGHLQLSGVLQKIAVCYLVAFHIYLWTGLRGVIVGIIGLNLLYLGLLYFYPVPGCGPGSLIVELQLPRLPRRDRARRLQVEQHGLRPGRSGNHPPRHHLGPVWRAGGTPAGRASGVSGSGYCGFWAGESS